MYNSLIDPDILIKYPSTNPHTILKFEKVVININYNKALLDSNNLYTLLEFLNTISINSRPKLLKAKNSISNFKRRKGVPIGYLFTIRKSKLYNFYIYFINFILPYLVRTYENKYKIFKPVRNNSFNIGIIGLEYPMNINFILNNKEINHKVSYFYSFYSFPILG